MYYVVVSRPIRLMFCMVTSDNSTKILVSKNLSGGARVTSWKSGKRRFQGM